MFLGTQGDNMRDRTRKGRAARGCKNGLSKLTENDIQLIFDLFNKGNTKISIANQFKVGETTIRNVLSGKIWKHVNIIKNN